DDLRTARRDHRLDREGHPRKELGTAPRRAEVRDLRILVVGASDAVADQAADDREAGSLHDGLDRVADVGDMVPDTRLRDPGRERLLADIEQALGLRRDLADPEGV